MADLAISLDDLMAMVGRAVADEADDMCPDGCIAFVLGKGNNAGDGWVAARLLYEAGREVAVHSVTDPSGLTAEAAASFQAAVAAGLEYEVAESPEVLAACLKTADLIVDGVFGFGLKGAAREPFASAIVVMDDADVPVLSIDLPSGVESDTGVVAGRAVRAEVTLAALVLKPAHVMLPASGYVGECRLADLGLDASMREYGEGLELWETEEYARELPLPAADAHKGTQGTVLVVGGSGGMLGSVSLAVGAALRSGAGYVKAAVPSSLVDLMNLRVPPVVALPLPEAEDRTIGKGAVDIVMEMARGADAIVVGPGIGTSSLACAVVQALVTRTSVPLVVDADALNCMVKEPATLLARKAPTVLTPHPGEAARLLGIRTDLVQSDRLAAAGQLSSEHVCCVLKGARTVVSGERRQVINMTGNPGMATMGSGDVLAGVVGAWLAVGLPPLMAGALAAYVHGLAGDYAALSLTMFSTTAVDVLEYLSIAFDCLLDTSSGDIL